MYSYHHGILLDQEPKRFMNGLVKERKKLLTKHLKILINKVFFLIKNIIWKILIYIQRNDNSWRKLVLLTKIFYKNKILLKLPR